MEIKDNLLNVAHLCPSSMVLGPGKRFVVWVQGCPFQCAGCIAPSWIPFEKAHAIPANLLAETIIRQEHISGITLSGGEPMMQARRLALMIQKIQVVRPELTVIVFSGFTKRQLIWDEAKELLSCTDLLIDGQYVRKKHEHSGLRGSSNQRFHFLTDRLLPYQTAITQQRYGLEFHLLQDGVLMAGIPQPGFLW